METLNNYPILYLAAYIAFAPVHFYILWLIFRFAVYLKDDLCKRLPILAPVMWITVIIGYLIDVAFNVLYGCVWFRQGLFYAFERNIYVDDTKLEWLGNSIVRLTLTGRLRYIKYNMVGWRLKRADKICAKWLTKYDKYHCSLNIIK